jgi:hypothetical protein
VAQIGGSAEAGGRTVPLPSGRSRRGRRVLCSLILAATLGACTVVKVRDERGVRVSYYPGVAVVKITSTDQVQVVEAESVGAAAIGNQFSLGWSHSRIALVPPGRCQFIAWRLTSDQLAELRGLLGPSTEICSSGGETR